MEDENFVISIIRTPIVYGPGVKANMLKMIHLVENFSLLPFCKVNNNRHYTYIENLVGFIDRIIEIRASGTFIAMDDFGLSTTSLVKYLAKFLHRKVILLKVPDILIGFSVSLKVPAVDQLYGSFYLNNNKTKELLNNKSLYSTEYGIEKMISNYLESKKIKNTK
jgi:UDP-glucose 4-epimerase